MVTVTWRGTPRELTRLHQAVAEHCECLGGMFGLPATQCSAHKMLTNQNALDHLLYVYRTRRLFIRRELYAMRSRSRIQTGVA
jgi:hypothetical protein